MWPGPANRSTAGATRRGVRLRSVPGGWMPGLGRPDTERPRRVPLPRGLLSPRLHRLLRHHRTLIAPSRETHTRRVPFSSLERRSLSQRTSLRKPRKRLGRSRNLRACGTFLFLGRHTARPVRRVTEPEGRVLRRSIPFRLRGRRPRSGPCRRLSGSRDSVTCLSLPLHADFTPLA